MRTLDFFPGGPGSNPITDVGFFFSKTMHHFLVKKFHILKMGAPPGGRLLGVAASSACDMFSWYRCLGVVLVFPASRLVGWEFLSGRAIS